MTASAKWAEAQNVLCVRLDTLGDVLMTTPAIRALRESVPHRRITLLTSASGAAAAALVPEIDDVIVYQAPWLKSGAGRSDGRPDSLADWLMFDKLSSQRFDAAVIFTVYSQSPLPSALMCHLADIPLRLAHCRENPYDLLTDWIRETEPDKVVRHEVRRQLDLVAAVGCTTSDERLSLRVPEEAARSVRRLLEEDLGMGADEPWVMIHPGATAASRRWPPEGFAAAADRLSREHGWRVVFTGDASEQGLIDSICGAMSPAAGAVSLAGRLSLAEMAALTAAAPLLISNNTGPVHIAAAVGTPVVDLYALTNPQHTPWAVPSRVLNQDVPCKWCCKSVCPQGHHDCLRLVTPDQVVEAALDLARETGRVPAPLEPEPLASRLPTASAIQL